MLDTSYNQFGDFYRIALCDFIRMRKKKICPYLCFISNIECGNMDIIKEISIKNFRSIRSLNRRISPTHLNIFVGQNDQGKSNVLRALNLFFNNQTDIGKSFRFDDDYCFSAPSGRGSRVEIKVELTIHPPASRFSQSTPVIWTKIWKKDGSIRETRKHPDGSTLNDRNNVSQWLNKLRYRYVPAVKGQDYFSTLMGELHDVLNTIHADELAQQGEGFIGGIQSITEEITNDLENKLGIRNTIQVPSDFRVLFSSLDFGIRKDGYTYHLKQRGDGIKVRHIPVILKYMSEQEKRLSIPGYVKPDTIWGFEEPENNLEFKSAFKVAEEIKKYSEDIQIFMTTHSPAFYSMDKSENDGVKSYFVSLNADGCTELRVLTHNDNDIVHEDMGFLPIITPYLQEIYEKDQKLSQAIERLETLESRSRCYVLTEDEVQGPVRNLLEHNSFDLSDTEFVSYDGADSIHAAVVLGQYIKTKNENAIIVVHRDRDYLSEEEINVIRGKVERRGFFFFTTIGTDVESHYVNSTHIHTLHPSLSIEQINQIISDATAETQQASIKRLVNHYMPIEKPRNGNYYDKFEELNTKYISNPERYRYGKKVLSRVSGKVQPLIGQNPNLIQYTDHIKHDPIIRIANDIWPDLQRS